MFSLLNVFIVEQKLLAIDYVTKQNLSENIFKTYQAKRLKASLKHAKQNMPNG